MQKAKVKNQKRSDRRRRIRSRISGDAKCPRVSIFRSNKGLNVQIIDDIKGVTLVSASNKDLSKVGKKVSDAKEIGKVLAGKAKSKKITEVVFDRGGYIYTGRVAALAEGLREGGLKF